MSVVHFFVLNSKKQVKRWQDFIKTDLKKNVNGTNKRVLSRLMS